MTLPVNLVLVRHGESEGNYANKMSRKGDHSYFTPEFMARHSSTWHLTDKGIEQAKITGEFLRAGFPRFDRYYTSAYYRARETAAYLGYSTCNWFDEADLREREWGDLDVLPDNLRRERFAEILLKREADTFFWRPQNGESLADLRQRIRWMLSTLHRECSDMNVVIVCHGEVMWVFRTLLERMPVEKFLKLDESDNPFDQIHNCQILHYTRRDPESGKLSKHADWMRSTCPSDLTRSSNSWHAIERPRYTNEELLDITSKLPRMISGD